MLLSRKARVLAQEKRPAPGTFEADMLALLPSLRRYSRSLSRSESEGEDLLQDCVEKALSSRARFRGVNLRSWVQTIMTNLYRNRFRTAVRHPLDNIDDHEHLAAPDISGDPLEHDRLHAGLDSLPAEGRAVLMLVVVEGYGYQEVADMLDIPLGTVMSRLSRARNRLRAQMTDSNIISMRRPK
jgi:RNA polymerase sigma-70 factor (ECF subfamily)